MARAPLAAITAIVISLGASRARGQQPRSDGAPGPDTLESARAMVAQSYREGKDLRLLDAQLDPLRADKNKLGAAAVNELLMQWEQGRFVQRTSKRLRTDGGPPDEVFVREIAATAEYFGVDQETAQRLYGVSGTPVPAILFDPAPPQERAVRAAAAKQQEAAAASQRIADALKSPDPGRLDVARETASSSRMATAAPPALDTPAGGGTLPHLQSTPTPAPTDQLAEPAPSGFLALLDLDWGQRLANAAMKIATKGEVPLGYCLRAFRFALERGGEIARATLGELGFDVDKAYEFGKNGEAHPEKLAAIGFLLVPRAEVRTLQARLGSLPPGTTLNYGKSCAGFDDNAGHIEQVVSSQPSPETGHGPVYRACYGICSRRTTEYINTYADPLPRRGSAIPPKACLRVFVPAKRTPASLTAAASMRNA